MKETLRPSIDSSAQGQLARERKLLQVKEKRMDIKEFYQCMGKHQRGSHYPLCVFTNNPGWRSAERHAQRAKRWKLYARLGKETAQLSKRIDAQASDYLRTFQTSGEDYGQAGAPDWYQNVDQIPYHTTDACYENCYYDYGDSAWRSASWSMPNPHHKDWGIASRQTVQDYRPCDDWAKAARARMTIDNYARRNGTDVKQRDAAVAAKPSQQ